VRLYRASNLNRGLNLAASAFCQREVLIDAPNHTISLSKIFDWYGGDFGPDPPKAVLNAIKPFLTAPQQQQLATLMASPYKVTFHSYDWSVNGTI